MKNIMSGWPVFGHGRVHVPCSQCSLLTAVNKRNVRKNFQGVDFLNGVWCVLDGDSSCRRVSTRQGEQPSASVVASLPSEVLSPTYKSALCYSNKSTTQTCSIVS